ncbi:MAG: hypothetical protein HC846_05935 [Blastocatellia bacterium]|nr:hypothetical protein [Blastocatellia bacterium]
MQLFDKISALLLIVKNAEARVPAMGFNFDSVQPFYPNPHTGFPDLVS